MRPAPSFDYVIVGSGFGGSVAALRLAEKGYRVLVLEAGRRFADADFARSSWDLRRFLYAPRFGLKGIMRLDFFRGLMVLSGAGVGGGSLVYANTLIEPGEAAFRNATWPNDVGIDHWDAELAAHYKTAKRMLGVTPSPTTFPADAALRDTAEALGFGQTFHPVNVGVYFGEPGVLAKDPFFGGEGPDRSGCVLCGGCMVGCRHNAKNTLMKNYLYLAEKKGVVVRDQADVRSLRPLPGGGFELSIRRPGMWSGRTELLAAPQIVLAAGVLGTMRLLLDARDGAGSMPALSPMLGSEVRTNSESIIGVRVPGGKVDFSRGVAIAAGVKPNGHTTIEAVRYPKGSDAMGLFSAPLVESHTFRGRLRELLAACAANPRAFFQRFWPRRFATETIILLVMQTLDSKLRLAWRRSALTRGRLSPRYGAGGRPPVHLAEGTAFAKAMADRLGGVAGGSISDVLGMSVTAHILGGCPMGKDAASGVIGADHQVHGYPGLYVVGGAAVPANLGVNPSLTITAMAERALSRVPHKAVKQPRRAA